MTNRYLNGRTLTIGALALLTTVAVYPDLLSYWPLLLIAACPVSMLLMGHGIHSGHAGHPHGSTAPASSFICPMHPGVRSDTEGRCPECGMALVKTATAGTATDRDQIARLRIELVELKQRQTDLSSEVERFRSGEAELRQARSAERKPEEPARRDSHHSAGAPHGR